MDNLKEVAKYNKDNYKKLPKIKWKFTNWLKNCFTYQCGNRLITIHFYDYRDTFDAVMEDFFIAQNDETIIIEYKIGQGDYRYKKDKKG